MDGENNGKPYEQMDDLVGKPPIFGNTHLPTLAMARLMTLTGIFGIFTYMNGLFLL